MGLFGQAKDLYKLQKQAKQIKKDLANLHIEAEVKGIVVVINGEQKIVDVRISEERWAEGDRVKMQADLKEAFNKAAQKAQEVAAEKMRGIMGDMGMNLPGTEGGQ
jgi:DNA-binding protein YbaB